MRAGGVSWCAPCHLCSIVCATTAHGAFGFYHDVHLYVLFVSEHASELGHCCSLTTVTSLP